ncbi:MAG: DUF4142 domain-containing protein [Lysobacteraceae bacterium]
MNSTLRRKRFAPLALATLAGLSLLAGCNHDNGNADTGNDMAAATPAAPNATTPADTTATTPADTTAMADANGMPPGTTADNASTMAGATPGTAAPATSADASAMAGDTAAGPVTDTAFYQEALSGGEKEIEASKLAEKSSDPQVKSLAKMIIADHTALGAKVKAAAGANPPTPATPDLSALTGKTGKDLDKAYVDMMVDDHQKDIPKFENASTNASTDQAKKLAGNALPTLRKHLEAAQKLQSTLQ